MKKLFSLMLAVLFLLTAAIAAAEGVPAGENIRKVTISCTGDALLGASESVRTSTLCLRCGWGAGDDGGGRKDGMAAKRHRRCSRIIAQSVLLHRRKKGTLPIVLAQHSRSTAPVPLDGAQETRWRATGAVF